MQHRLSPPCVGLRAIQLCSKNIQRRSTRLALGTRAVGCADLDQRRGQLRHAKSHSNIAESSSRCEDCLTKVRERWCGGDGHISSSSWDRPSSKLRPLSTCVEYVRRSLAKHWKHLNWGHALLKQWDSLDLSVLFLGMLKDDDSSCNLQGHLLRSACGAGVSIRTCSGEVGRALQTQTFSGRLRGNFPF